MVRERDSTAAVPDDAWWMSPLMVSVVSTLTTGAPVDVCGGGAMSTSSSSSSSSPSPNMSSSSSLRRIPCSSDAIVSVVWCGWLLGRGHGWLVVWFVCPVGRRPEIT